MVFPHEDPAPEKPKSEEKPKLTDPEKDLAMKALPVRIGKCFLCKWILQDLVKNGNLTGHPKSEFSGAMFPEKAKITHLKLEKILI